MFPRFVLRKSGAGKVFRLLLIAFYLPSVITLSALEAPKGRPLLTIRGKISITNVGSTAVFDGEMLDAFPQHTFSSPAPWHTGKATYRGPLLRDILKAVGASGESLYAYAINEYRVAIPVSDAQKFDVIVARWVNGEVLSSRVRGPIMTMYPLDLPETLRNQVINGRCVWHLHVLEVR